MYDNCLIEILIGLKQLIMMSIRTIQNTNNVKSILNIYLFTNGLIVPEIINNAKRIF